MHYILAILCQCQNIHTLTGAELAIYAFKFPTNILPGHGMTYRGYTQKTLFKFAFRGHSYSQF